MTVKKKLEKLSNGINRMNKVKDQISDLVNKVVEMVDITIE